MSFYEMTENGFLLKVKVQPSSSQNKMIGLIDNPPRLKIKLKSPPVEGKANQELVKFLSKTLLLPVSKFKIIRGETSRAKDILINTDQDFTPFFAHFELVAP